MQQKDQNKVNIGVTVVMPIQLMIGKNGYVDTEMESKEIKNKYQSMV